MSNDQTQPTIETVLERMNEWGVQFKNGFAELRSGQSELHRTVDELRSGHDQLRQAVDELRKGQEELHKGQEELHKGQEELRGELHASLYGVTHKIEALNDNILTIQANMRNLGRYIERLESGLLAPK
jgi:exonuclease VII small subunit